MYESLNDIQLQLRSAKIMITSTIILDHPLKCLLDIYVLSDSYL